MTTLEIWNAALALLPHDRTVEAEDEDSTEALRCRQHWDAARRYVLGARDWGWLVQSAPACCGFSDLRGFVSRPPDALVIVGIFDGTGRRVTADPIDGGFRVYEPVAEIRYIVDEPDPDRWPQAVQEAVTAELAARLAHVLTDNPQRAQLLRQNAIASLEEAGRRDAQETAWSGHDPLMFVHSRR